MKALHSCKSWDKAHLKDGVAMRGPSVASRLGPLPLDSPRTWEAGDGGHEGGALKWSLPLAGVCSKLAP